MHIVYVEGKRQREREKERQRERESDLQKGLAKR
jgi:parvulin-like peptidyl-prolyl isomerase